ncbi:MAG TPA: FHA domain-containing protein [Nocardioides sp.]|nr:FHA domain-containing protein [Nocardioides sp.]
MTSTCPAGHLSSADDYCDVCGLPIGEQHSQVEPVDTPQVEPVETPSEVATSEAPAVCPNCQVVNPANALFCEACGYDFTTGSMPRPLAPLAPTSDTGGEAPPPIGAAPTTPAAPAIEPGWVAEIWIDPDWYAAQESDDPLPSAGLPTVVPLRVRSLLVGRASQSRAIHPDIDLSSDSGISRRHCQLTTDGTRWWVEDLGSSNGTYVADAVGPLPTTPLVQGQRRELDGDDRIYLGAWTRLVIRKAAPGEA